MFREVASGKEELPGGRAVREAQWLEVLDIDSETHDPGQAALRNELDRGEAAAIVLAKSIDADLLVIDERQGRRVAQRLGLDVRGTLGVLLQSKREGLLDPIRPVLERLREEGAWIGEDLFRTILEAAGEEPSDLVPEE